MNATIDLSRVKIRPAGDRFVLVEFGRAMTLELNFRAQAVALAIRSAEIEGVVDTAPCFASILVEYDPARLSQPDLGRELERLCEVTAGPAGAVLPSRLWYLPVLYLDPWTRECVARYSRDVRARAYDPETLAREHGLDDARAFVRMHAGTEWWIAAIGSWPGLPFCMALDPRCRLSAAKYDPPRTTTPRGAIGLGGGSTAIYSVESPGGYQIFGRTPVPIFDPARQLSAFRENAVVLRAGDRIRFVPIDRDEYDAIDSAVAAGHYVHERIDYQQFAVREYLQWAAGVAPRATA